MTRIHTDTDTAQTHHMVTAWTYHDDPDPGRDGLRAELAVEGVVVDAVRGLYHRELGQPGGQVPVVDR